MRQLTARLCRLEAVPDPWDPFDGVVELELEVDSGVGLPAGVWRYRVADPLLAGQPLVEQMLAAERRIRSRLPLTVAETAGRQCPGCRQTTATPWCGHCGIQVYAGRDGACPIAAHAARQGVVAHCPDCGVGLGAVRRRSRFERLDTRADDDGAW